MLKESIDSLAGSLTLLIIAHRLSTIRACDTILVLDKGRIVEKGTWTSLLAKKGKFREMVHAQRK